MKSFIILAALSGSLVSATPHRHIYNHFHNHQAAHKAKRQDDPPVTWVTEWVSVVTTVEVTTTFWVTPSSPEPSQVVEVKQDAPAEVPTIPSPVPAQFFEPQKPSTLQSSPVQNVQPAEITPFSNPSPAENKNDVELTKPQEVPVEENVPATPEPLAPSVNESIGLPSENTSSSLDHAVSTGTCSSGSPCSGDITFYDPGVGAGACGWQNTKDEPVVALPHGFMGEKSNGNPYCGKTVTIVHNGKTSTARVVDKCMGCTGFSIDLSNSVFSQLEALSVGRASAQWWIN